MKVPADLPSRLAMEPFSTAEAERLGINRQRTRAGDLISPTNGVRLPVGIAEEVKSRAHAYTIAAPNAVVSHTTAALLWGFPLPLSIEQDDVIHL
ncbi:MAG TPA: hypothetical protein VFM62_04415, partial [Arthrobacter sp.]|nr:hypothetical protein [Arthrobacter sp.]